MTEKEKGRPKPETPAEDPAKELLEALKVVTDPEIGISIVDLGLIYGIEVEEGRARIRMTLTSQGCPAGGEIMTAVHRVAADFLGLKPEKVQLDLVWSPPWDPRVHATEDGKFLLGII